MNDASFYIQCLSQIFLFPLFHCSPTRKFVERFQCYRAEMKPWKIPHLQKL